MKNTGTKTGLFLIELVVALLLFAFCASICTQLFTAARIKAQDSQALSKSVQLASSVAEFYKVAGGDIDDVSRLWDRENDGGVISISYDKNWQETENEASYVMTLTDMGGGVAEIEIITIRLTDKQVRSVYSMMVKAVGVYA